MRRALVEDHLAVVLDYTFHIPLEACAIDYLERRVLPLLKVAIPGVLIDDVELTLTMRPITLEPVKRRLASSLIRIDGTGLYKELFGLDQVWRGITFSLQFEPDEDTPRYAREIYWGAASIWSCDAPDSIRAKAQHFKRQLIDAAAQLPPGQPSTVHTAAEAYDGEGVEAARYDRMRYEMIAEFDPGDRKIELIYCHIFWFEVPFDGNWDAREDCTYWALDRESPRYLLEPILLIPESEQDLVRP